MMTFVLNGTEIGSRKELHEKLAEGLCLPEWYGANLDALYDCLTELEETTIRVTATEVLRGTLGGYAAGLFRVLREAAEDNPRLHVER